MLPGIVYSKGNAGGIFQQPQYMQRNSVPKDLRRTRHNMSDSYAVYEKQPASNYQTRGQWIPRCCSTIMIWCIAPPSFTENWWNRALVCYHTHHILKTWPHATFVLFMTLENTVWWPLWQWTECQVKVLCLTEGEAFQNCFQDPYTSCPRCIRADRN
jgi:hypothetical protein